MNVSSQSPVNKKLLAYKRWEESKITLEDDDNSSCHSSHKSIRIPSPVMKRLNSVIPVLPQDIIKNYDLANSLSPASQNY